MKNNLPLDFLQEDVSNRQKQIYQPLIYSDLFLKFLNVLFIRFQNNPKNVY